MPQIRFDWTQDRSRQMRRATRALEAGAVLIGVPPDVRGELEDGAHELGLEVVSYECVDGWCLYRADAEVDVELPPRRDEAT